MTAGGETVTAHVAAVEHETRGDVDLLLFIRRFEERLLTLFAAGHVSGTTHTSIGQEYIPVALAPLLRGDFVLSNHRGHGHFLAHCGDARALLAEILGREAALNNGVGGSQHLRSDNFLSTGIQGESLPVAAGIALYFADSDDRRLAVAYIGDGTWGEGAVYEALNMASLWRLPLLTVVEHNGIAQSTPTQDALAGMLADRATAFGIGHTTLTTRKLAEIRRVVAPVVDSIRRERCPHVLIFNTVRLGAHSKGDDTRSSDEIARLRAEDWLTELSARRPADVARADERALARIEDLTNTVLNSPEAHWWPA